MSTDTNIDVIVEDNLDAFSADFFGENKQASDTAKSEDEQVETEANDDATNDEQDTHSAEDGATEGDDESSDENPDETDEDTEAKAKPKANRLQERINELTAARREAERRAEEAERKLAEQSKPKTEATPAKAQSTTVGPDPQALNEDGTNKYPLGEFDPKFLRDTVQHMLAEERKERELEEQRTKELTAQESERANLQSSWDAKLDTAQERYPDFREKGEQMLEVFEGIDEAYGQYLTDTLMEMDHGPEVFYYLANNIDEANAIVNAGPRKATMALAALEVKLVGSPKPQDSKPKTTNAPTPPPRVKGSAVAKPSVSPDTDDLDAFSRELFKKR